MRIADSILPEFEHEMKTTRRLLERVPDDRSEWKPHDKSSQLGALAAHIAYLPSWVTMTFGTSEFDLAGRTVRGYTNTADLLASFDEHVAAAKATLQSVENDAFGVPWSLRRGEQTLFTMPRAAVVRMFAINHLIHHRGQLSVYLRLLDVALPSVYGPTADEPV